eukprot:1234701-Pyramimonas_sp.AAC.1
MSEAHHSFRQVSLAQVVDEKSADKNRRNRRELNHISVAAQKNSWCPYLPVGLVEPQDEIM